MFLIPNCVGIVWKITANQFFLKACKQTQHTLYIICVPLCFSFKTSSIEVDFGHFSSTKAHTSPWPLQCFHELILNMNNLLVWLHNVSIYSTIPSPSLCRQGLQNSINIYTFASNFPRFSHWSTPWWDDEMRVGDMQFYILINETFILSHVHFVTKRTYSNVH